MVDKRKQFYLREPLYANSKPCISHTTEPALHFVPFWDMYKPFLSGQIQNTTVSRVYYVGENNWLIAYIRKQLILAVNAYLWIEIPLRKTENNNRAKYSSSCSVNLDQRSFHLCYIMKAIKEIYNITYMRKFLNTDLFKATIHLPSQFLDSSVAIISVTLSYLSNSCIRHLGKSFFKMWCVIDNSMNLLVH